MKSPLIIANFAGGEVGGMTAGNAYRKSVVVTVIGPLFEPERLNLFRTAERTKLSSSLAGKHDFADKYCRNAAGDICPRTTFVIGKNTPGALSSMNVTSKAPSALTNVDPSDSMVNLIAGGWGRVNVGSGPLTIRGAS
jgi:paraquat-inducible protein B